MLKVGRVIRVGRLRRGPDGKLVRKRDKHGEPKFYPDGSPAYELEETGYRCEEDPGGDCVLCDLCGVALCEAWASEAADGVWLWVARGPGAQVQRAGSLADALRDALDSQRGHVCDPEMAREHARKRAHTLDRKQRKAAA